MATDGVTASWLASRIDDCSANGIAATVTELVRNGELEISSRLPTVRQLAEHLGVSPGTVSAAWLMLRRRRVIVTRRRGGTTVVGPPGAPHPRRFESVGNFGDQLRIDLTFATPDPKLLPRLGGALRDSLSGTSLNTYSQETITPRLRAALEPRWPFPAADWMAANGGYDGVFAICQANIASGDLVAIDNPTAPRLIDTLTAVDARIVPVRCDGQGPVPDSLRQALDRGASAFVYQTRAHNPSGHNVTESRARHLAQALRKTTTLIIEDDGLGDLATADIFSLGRHFPDRTVHVQSFSKPYGPDLRVGVVAGAQRPIELARAYRNFSSRWTSRILQDGLAHLLADPACTAQVQRARETYNKRQLLLAEAMSANGIDVRPTDALSLWIPVPDERYALVTLAAHGIAASPGSPYFVDRGPAHIRVATSHLDTGYEYVADCVALAAQLR